ncbi:nicotinate-nucleotide--dimethylbenzimidazole phosphoribosyltransferase [Chitinimonas sp.]|uniref:nicotinate-nucleotide--dimethylbenzimidazole phosphoribosyltransferase n=1 Tax=Chitinimonas sp. TaxID=1934313 RepID=UPI002F958E12
MQTHWWAQAPYLLDHTAATAAAQRQRILTKPEGALGELERLVIRLAFLQGRERPHLAQPWISVFAADHGIAEAGVSAYPREVTAQMVANFSRGGAAICVLAKQINARFEVVDVGVASDTSALPGVVQAKTVAGTDNFLTQPAMQAETLTAALAAGRAAAQRAKQAGADCFIGGEMGIGNTSSASALAAVWLGEDVADLVGPGTGLNPEAVARKARLLQDALTLHAGRLDDPFQALATLGGCEIAALAGAYIACAQLGLPVLVDGLISSVAALAACRLNPGTADWLLFGHQSAEPAHAKVLKALNGTPMLQLGMRLGEGSGAASAYPILQLACALHAGMATFEQAGVSDRDA